MHLIKLQVEDNIYHNVMFLLKNLNLNGLKIKEDKIVITEEINNYTDWSEEELKDIGKIGFSSKSFVEDSEDYTKW